LAAAPRSADDGPICDRIHQLSARFHRRFFDNPVKANALLISSSLVIDLLGRVRPTLLPLQMEVENLRAHSAAPGKSE
jgi:hypothetical protein